MTVVRRPSPKQRTRGRRAPLAERFPKGLEVEVRSDYSDARYQGRFGKVMKVLDERDDIYPRGRVAVLLVWQELHQKVFGGKAPNPVWFNPYDLEKRDA